MKNKLLLLVFFINLLSVTSCKKQDPVPIEEDPFPATGEYPKLLTQDNFIIGNAFFSPDGKHIAFYSIKYTIRPYLAGVSPELWTMRSDGFDLRRVILEKSIYDLTIPTLICWNSDSKSMMVHIQDSDWDYKSEIWQVAVTGERTKLYAPNLRLEKLTYSPDKSKLAYIIQGPNPPMGSPVYKLYVANTDFSDSIRIEKGLIGDYEWQGDSKGLIYSFYDRPNQNHDLWKASIDGTSKLRFSETPENEEHFSTSTDGKYMAYYVSKSVYVTPTALFSPQKIMDNASGPAWIPGRNYLLVGNEQTDGNGAYWSEPWIIDMQGNIIRKFPKGVYGITFYSDGHHFLYNSEESIWMDYLP